MKKLVGVGEPRRGVFVYKDDLEASIQVQGYFSWIMASQAGASFKSGSF